MKENANETVVAVIDTADVEQVEQTEQEHALTRVVTEIELRAEAITIESEDDYKKAGEFGRALKQKTSEVKDYWKPIKDAAYAAHRQICDREKAMLQPLTNADNALRKAMSAYVMGQEKIRKAAEEAARKAAQEEAERRMQEAIEHEKSGNMKMAAAIAEEAEIIEEAASTVSVASQKPKVEGVSTVKDWEITSVDNTKVPIMMEGMELRPVDTAAVMKLIRATSGRIKIPGIEFKETVQMRFRK